MPSTSYRCKYCHQRKPTETALNRHIAHSALCYQAWQENIARLTSTDIAVDGSINRKLEESMPQELLGNVSDIEASRPDERVPPINKKISVRHSEEADDVDVDDAHLQNRYRRGFPVRYAPEILGEGKTNFQIWQDEQTLHGENEWAPFLNQKEWDLARWLIRNVGQRSMDEFLKLTIASKHSPV